MRQLFPDRDDRDESCMAIMYDESCMAEPGAYPTLVQA